MMDLQIANAGEGVGKRELPYTVDGNVNLCSHYEKQYRVSSKNKIELSYDPAISLLGIYLDNTLIKKDTCTPMLKASLFTIVKAQKQPKCALTNEWI